MKKTVIVLVFLFLLQSIFSLNSFGVAENLIKNPSFEVIDANSQPVDWEFSPKVVDADFIQYKCEKDGAHSGNYYAAIRDNGKPIHCSFGQVVNVRENTNYRISCWMRSKNVPSNKVGARILIDGKIENASISGDNPDWQNVELYLSVPAGISTVKVTVGLGGYGSENTGDVDFDDMEMVEVSSIPDDAAKVQLQAPGTDSGTKVSGNDSNNGGSGSSSQNDKVKGNLLKLFVVVLILLAIPFVYYKFGNNIKEKFKANKINPGQPDNTPQVIVKVADEEKELIPESVEVKIDNDKNNRKILTVEIKIAMDSKNENSEDQNKVLETDGLI